jgi:hypothetical protein
LLLRLLGSAPISSKRLTQFTLLARIAEKRDIEFFFFDDVIHFQ